MDRLPAPEPVSAGDVRRRALLIAPPGETYLLGVRMVAKFLELSGWDVTIEDRLPAEDNARTVAAEWFGVVGVSVSAASRAAVAARAVAAVRVASLNPDVAIMAGGTALLENPQARIPDRGGRRGSRRADRRGPCVASSSRGLPGYEARPDRIRRFHQARNPAGPGDLDRSPRGGGRIKRRAQR